MLFLLRDEGGFEGRMLGVDYSAQSVELCRGIAAEKGLRPEVGGAGAGGVEFAQWDILGAQPPPADWTEPGFDIVLDKGTFDAVSLSGAARDGRRGCEGYAARVEGLVRRGTGVLVVTSCNWTEEELGVWFERGGEGGLERVGRVEYPVFRFGGAEGQSVQSVVFRRRG